MFKQQLINFQKVAQLNNMSRAAEELNTTQSAISKSIASLENELSINLFDRNGKKISLSSAGKEVLKHVETIISELNHIKQISITNNVSEPIHILAKAADQLIPEIIFKLNEIHPDITTKVSHYQSDTIDPDIVITSSLEKHAGKNGITVLKENFVLIAPKNHVLASKKEISIADLKNHPMVFLGNDIPLREIMLHWFNEEGVKPIFSYECDSCVMMREILNTGKGIGLVPSKTWNLSLSENLVAIPLTDQKCYRYVNIYFNSKQESKVLSRVYQFIITYFDNFK